MTIENPGYAQCWASSVKDGTAQGTSTNAKGRLDDTPGWTPFDHLTSEDNPCYDCENPAWWQLDLDLVRQVVGVVTQGNSVFTEQVLAYTVNVSTDGLIWTEVDNSSHYDSWFVGNIDEKTGQPIPRRENRSHRCSSWPDYPYSCQVLSTSESSLCAYYSAFMARRRHANYAVRGVGEWLLWYNEYMYVSSTLISSVSQALIMSPSIHLAYRAICTVILQWLRSSCGIGPSVHSR